MDTFLHILEMIGTIAFAVSGAMTGIRKHLDLFGVAFLGIVTAVGGGILRDVMIGATPPGCFRNPVYLEVAAVTALLFFVPFLRHPLVRRQVQFDRMLFAMDSLGLAVFTVTGVLAGLESNPDASPVLLLTVGMLTATGGGVLRDVMAGDTPLIFVKHIYASASLAGALLFVVLNAMRLPVQASGILAAAAVFIIRCLAAHFRWNFPKAAD